MNKYIVYNIRLISWLIFNYWVFNLHHYKDLTRKKAIAPSHFPELRATAPFLLKCEFYLYITAESGRSFFSSRRVALCSRSSTLMRSLICSILASVSAIVSAHFFKSS